MSNNISYLEFGFLKWILPLLFGAGIGIIFLEWLGKKIMAYYMNDVAFFGVMLGFAVVWYFSTTFAMNKILKFIPSPIKQQKNGDVA